VYWGEQLGAVRGQSNASNTSTTYAENGDGSKLTTSVGYDGTRLMWIWCSQPGNSFCSLESRRGAEANRTLLGSAGVGARNLAWDSSQVFWISASGIKSYRHQ
jgi:hypothetical protein